MAPNKRTLDGDADQPRVLRLYNPLLGRVTITSVAKLPRVIAERATTWPTPTGALRMVEGGYIDLVHALDPFPPPSLAQTIVDEYLGDYLTDALASLW